MSTEKPCDRFDGAQAPTSATAPTVKSTLTVTNDLAAARKLRDAYRGVGGASVFGQIDTMPEEELAHDIKDDFDRLMYLTLAVSIDYQRDALSLWRHARQRYDDPETRWLFDPLAVAARTPEDVLVALRRGDPRGALRYPAKDAAWWHRNSTTFVEHYAGDPRVLFEQCAWDVVRIRREVNRPGRFQGLKGPKIFPLWIRMLADIQRYPFASFDALPIPVDVHVARATFTTGLMRGRYEGPFDANLIDVIRRAWTDACRAAGESHMTFDEPLWQLSRLGCTHRHERASADCPIRATCPIGDLCPRGTIELSTAGVRIDT